MDLKTFNETLVVHLIACATPITDEDAEELIAANPDVVARGQRLGEIGLAGTVLQLEQIARAKIEQAKALAADPPKVSAAVRAVQNTWAGQPAEQRLVRPSRRIIPRQ